MVQGSKCLLVSDYNMYYTVHNPASANLLPGLSTLMTQWHWESWLFFGALATNVVDSQCSQPCLGHSLPLSLLRCESPIDGQLPTATHPPHLPDFSFCLQIHPFSLTACTTHATSASCCSSNTARPRDNSVLFPPPPPTFPHRQSQLQRIHFLEASYRLGAFDFYLLQSIYSSQLQASSLHPIVSISSIPPLSFLPRALDQ